MAIQRHEAYSFDDMYYVTGFEQSLHFQQLFKILELLGFDWASKCHHIPFGRVKGMPSRKGESLWEKFVCNSQLVYCCLFAVFVLFVWFQTMPFFLKIY